MGHRSKHKHSKHLENDDAESRKRSKHKSSVKETPEVKEAKDVKRERKPSIDMVDGPPATPKAAAPKPTETPPKEKPKVAEAGDFALNAANWLLSHNNADLLMDLRDSYWCETILGRTPGNLADLVNIFLRSHNVYADEKSHWGPPKWQYSNDPYDSFDHYMRNGCPNCGMEFSTDYPHDICLKPVPILLCKACGHVAAPLHFDNESESFVDRLQKQKPTEKVDAPGAVYLKGTRRVHDFGQNGKEWWQSYYLPASYRLESSQATLAGSDLLGDSKGEKVKEVCEVCGHDEAFFATFQARSADEGLTIMYECTRCHSRKTFNN
eukprot:Blabericola_migrator_1__13584@NODE_99_length_14373_cov_95_300643_g89_i0_p5_GENE_NODE_99_length_14373_cov_95_300643_g89_i0NODE_99_length_14373_cov_95_300643_g89_i0_p5_ORF_typecomplete_len323_score74_89TFIIS_C/PF01096_18/4_1e02TFIIS_C/PF01096_18/2_7e02TFIIS_C/PF01096_18/1_1e10DEC1_N/PF04625_13/0_026DUF1660/PF07874_11/1_1e02DUF1660/PF07874_11/9_9e02DUF1660/PF07874_11/6_5DUF1660/PF07874_11/4_6Zn_Tnp_IS1595/PF12760_7/46Zn_Tnp_IS1595/PF12760_7/0_78DUF983/PF06170_12/22DUF983/PF06170_12/66zf_Rg/PF17915_